VHVIIIVIVIAVYRKKYCLEENTTVYTFGVGQGRGGISQHSGVPSACCETNALYMSTGPTITAQQRRRTDFMQWRNSESKVRRFKCRVVPKAVGLRAAAAHRVLSCISEQCTWC
jgi:hypothetical protein